MKKLLFTIAILLPTLALAQQYSIDWYTIAGGGGTSTGGAYSLSGTIGQATAADWSGANGKFALTGFWAIQRPGAPALTVNPASAGQITISWVPNMPGWILQESPSLSSPTWTNSASGSTNPATVPAAGGQKFFRLYKP